MGMFTGSIGLAGGEGYFQIVESRQLQVSLTRKNLVNDCIELVALRRLCCEDRTRRLQVLGRTVGNLDLIWEVRFETCGKESHWSMGSVVLGGPESW